MEIACVITTRGSHAKFKRILELRPETKTLGLNATVDSFIPSLSAIDHLDCAKNLGDATGYFAWSFNKMDPDLIMLVGDRWETFAAATAAYTMRIPIAHLEGGEKSGSLDHGYRYAISQLSNYHFVCTEAAKTRLKFKKNVWNVGATSLDVLDDLREPHGHGGQLYLPPSKFLLVTFHPDTKADDNEQVLDSLIEGVMAVDMPAVWIAPNIDAGSQSIRDVLTKTGIPFHEGFPIEEYGWLMKNCACMVGNSSSGVREASFLGTPNLTIGDRQTGRKSRNNAWIRNFLGDSNNIAAMINTQVEHGPYEPDHTYGDGHASERILECLERVLS